MTQAWLKELFRLNPGFKLDIHNMAVSNEFKTVQFESGCQGCNGGIPNEGDWDQIVINQLVLLLLLFCYWSMYKPLSQNPHGIKAPKGPKRKKEAFGPWAKTIIYYCYYHHYYYYFLQVLICMAKNCCQVSQSLLSDCCPTWSSITQGSSSTTSAL